MRLRSWAAILGLIGFGVGGILCTLYTMVINSFPMEDGQLHLCNPEFVEQVGSVQQAILLQLLISGVYFSIVMACIVVFAFERWSLLKATAVHFVVSFSAFFITAFRLHWMSLSDLPRCAIALILGLISYCIVWIIFYRSTKSDVDEINDMLVELKNREAI